MKKILFLPIFLIIISVISQAENLNIIKQNLNKENKITVNNNYNNNEILETEDAYVYEFDMPGLENKNIKIYIKDNILYITGKQNKTDIIYNNILAKNRNYSYNINIKKDFNINKINHFMKNGILRVVISKN